MFLPWRVSQSFFPFFFFLITWSSSHWLVFLQSVFVCHMKSADKKAINCKGCNFKGWFYYQLSTKCTILSGAILESCKLAERQSLQWRIKRKPQGDKQLGGGQEWDPPTVLRILNRQQNKKGWKKTDMRAAPSNFHLPSSYLSHFGWIASRTTSFFFNRNSTSLWWCKSLQALLSLERLLNCSKSDQCSPSFYSIKTGTYWEFSFAARKSVQGYHLAEGKGDSMFQSLKVKAAQSGLILCAPWTVACQAPVSMGILQTRILERVAISFSRDLLIPGTEPRSPASQADSLPSEPPGKSFSLWLMGLDAFTTKVPMVIFSSGGRSWVSSTWSPAEASRLEEHFLWLALFKAAWSLPSVALPLIASEAGGLQIAFPEKADRKPCQFYLICLILIPPWGWSGYKALSHLMTLQFSLLLLHSF